jgi:signal transduction histidine kinase
VFGTAKHRPTAFRGHRDLRWWPLLLLLLAVVLLPTACLLWLMSRAIDNERLAVRQLLADTYRRDLVRLQGRWDEHWRAKAAELDRVAVGKPPQERFMELWGAGLADSIICCDKQHRPAYPTLSSQSLEQPADSTAWVRANDLELTAAGQKPRLLEAAAAYAAIAKDAVNVNIAARAMLAQARCLAKGGWRDQAIVILADTLAGDRFRHAVDASGRLIVADAELRVLELIGDRRSPQFQGFARRLTSCLNDYSDPLLGSCQRLFLMKALMQLDESATLPTLYAEELAAKFLESGESLSTKPVLQPSKTGKAWQFASTDGRVVAIFGIDTVLGELEELADKEELPTDLRVELIPPDRTGLIRIKVFAGWHPPGARVGALPARSRVGLLPPDQMADASDLLHVLPAGGRMPGWQLGLAWNDEQVVNATAHGKIVAYMLTGLLAVAVAAVLALWIALRFLRQMRLTRLKNDLVATVSHELKTPLASIRLLVDTLLGDKAGDQRQVREYLELIAKENTRLSRLIDNFLTFSRMERNKQAFSFSPIEPAAIVAAAVDAVRERFEQSGCRFETQVEPDLPMVMADADAITTALVNLLDNAWKYTDADKHIVLRADGNASVVCFGVTDNGIGLSRSACKKVFQRFYQVDRELSRSRGGCGLGLSIVEFIVLSHGGWVTVQSQPGRGSTFTITLPKAAES